VESTFANVGGNPYASVVKGMSTLHLIACDGVQPVELVHIILVTGEAAR
jgi:hypothetical protein